MILVNTETISGKELEMLGLVKGSTIQSKHLGKDISQAFKTLVGGELKKYNEMMAGARDIATQRMEAFLQLWLLGVQTEVCAAKVRPKRWRKSPQDTDLRAITHQP